MVKIVVIIGIFIGLLLALILWLNPANNLLDYNSPKTNLQVSEPNGINLNTAIKQTKIDNPDNGQRINETLFRKEFQPKTTWSDKTISFHGTELTYRFGEGNPIEVALPPEQYLPKDGKEGEPYVTAQAEYQLKAFLSDDNLPELLNKCVNYLNHKMASQNSEVPVNQLVSVLENKDVDIENYLIIDPQSGRKMINPESDSRMNEFLNTLSNPLDPSPLVTECFGVNRIQDFKTVQKKFHDLGRAYIHSGKAYIHSGKGI